MDIESDIVLALVLASYPTPRTQCPAQAFPGARPQAIGRSRRRRLRLAGRSRSGRRFGWFTGWRGGAASSVCPRLGRFGCPRWGALAAVDVDDQLLVTVDHPLQRSSLLDERPAGLAHAGPQHGVDQDSEDGLGQRVSITGGGQQPGGVVHHRLADAPHVRRHHRDFACQRFEDGNRAGFVVRRRAGRHRAPPEC